MGDNLPQTIVDNSKHRSHADCEFYMPESGPKQQTSSRPHKRKAPPKRNDARAPKEGKRAIAQFEKKTPTTILLTTFMKAYFSITCSNRGILPMVDSMYSILEGRDSKLARAISKDQLLYVSHLAYLARCARVVSECGTSIIRMRDELLHATKGLLLPDFIASYIESIGIVDLHGARIVPHFTGISDVISSPIDHDPADIFMGAERPVPDNEWMIDADWILSYQSNIARALKGGLSFRNINWSDNSGNVTFLCSYRWLDDDRCSGFCPMPANETDVRLGALRKYRNEDGRRYWTGPDDSCLYPFTCSKDFNFDFELQSLILHSLQKEN